MPENPHRDPEIPLSHALSMVRLALRLARRARARRREEPRLTREELGDWLRRKHLLVAGTDPNATPESTLTAGLVTEMVIDDAYR